MKKYARQLAVLVATIIIGASSAYANDTNLEKCSFVTDNPSIAGQLELNGYSYSLVDTAQMSTTEGAYILTENKQSHDYFNPLTVFDGQRCWWDGDCSSTSTAYYLSLGLAKSGNNLELGRSSEYSADSQDGIKTNLPDLLSSVLENRCNLNSN